MMLINSRMPCLSLLHQMWEIKTRRVAQTLPRGQRGGIRKMRGVLRRPRIAIEIVMMTEGETTSVTTAEILGMTAIARARAREIVAEETGEVVRATGRRQEGGVVKIDGAALHLFADVVVRPTAGLCALLCTPDGVLRNGWQRSCAFIAPVACSLWTNA